MCKCALYSVCVEGRGGCNSSEKLGAYVPCVLMGSLFLVVPQIHVVNGHKFSATHFTVPPVCVVCAKKIVALGRGVYLCGTCGCTAHKKCHVRTPLCAGAPASEA